MAETLNNHLNANGVNTLLGADNVSIKKAEILSGIFRTKDGLTWNETTELLNELILLAENGKWIECSIKEAPLESDILFQTKVGIIYAGIRFMPTKRSNKPVYQDFKKNKIRQHVIRWRFICA
jgi:hypothetical protein